MIRTALLGFIFFSVINVYGQTPYVSSNHIAGTRVVDYTLNGVQSGWPAFYFFEDGYYSIRPNPRHEYYTGGAHTPTVYSATNYDPTFPSKVAPSPTNPNPVPTNAVPFVGAIGSSTSTPRFQSWPNNFNFPRVRPINIGTSWSAVEGRKQVYIITFTNPYTDLSAPAIDGTIRFDLNPVIQSPNVDIWNSPSNPNHSYNGWANGGNKTVNAAGNVESVEWGYTGLMPQEIRHLYVEVELPMGSHSQRLTSNVHMTWDDIFYGVDDSSASVITSVAKKPRDPNYIEVNHDFVKSSNPNNQKLEYEVGFYNEGEWYAKDIYVYVNLDDDETQGASSVNYLSSSFPCKLSVINNSLILFTFNNIFLPGLGQDSTFTHSDVSGFVNFSLCTNTDLQPGPNHLITADAEIYFDAIGPVITKPDTTMVEGGTTGMDFCGFDDDIDGFSIPDQPIADRTIFSDSAYPNPFSQQLNIPYEIVNEYGENISIKLYSITGQEQITLFSGYQYQGIYNFTHDTSSLPAGSYLLVIQNGKERMTQRLIKLDQ